MSEMLVPVLTFLAPTFIIGVLGAWLTFRYLHPFLLEIGATPWNRRVTQQVLFAGVVNAEPQQLLKLRKLRVYYSGLIGLVLLFAGMLLGFGAVLFLGILLSFNFLLSRPFEVTEANK